MKRILEYPELIIALLALVFVAVLTCITAVRIFVAWKRDGKRKSFRSWYKEWCKELHTNAKTHTPPKPEDIVTVKPDQHKPWCQNCHEHTRYKTKTVTKRTTGNEGSSTTIQVTHYSCRHCKAEMFTPSKQKVMANYGAPLFGICGCAVHTVLTVGYCKWLQLKGPLFTPVMLGIPFLVWPVLTFYCWRWLRHSSGYHSWLQWTNER